MRKTTGMHHQVKEDRRGRGRECMMGFANTSEATHNDLVRKRWRSGSMWDCES